MSRYKAIEVSAIELMDSELMGVEQHRGQFLKEYSFGEVKEDLREKVAMTLGYMSHGATEVMATGRAKIDWNRWVRVKRDMRENADFVRAYEVATDSMLKVWEHKMMQMALNESRDVIDDPKYGLRSNTTSVKRDELLIKTMHWIMGKERPARYSDRMKMEHKVEKDLQPVVNYNPKEKFKSSKVIEIDKEEDD